MIRSLGPPLEEYRTETTRTLVWSRTKTEYQSDTTYYESIGRPKSETTTSSDTLSCEFQFTIKEGKVTDYTERGNGCQCAYTYECLK